MTNGKDKSIELMKIIAMILVVIGHSFPVKGSPEYMSSLWICIYYFHMPLFFFISGYTVKKYGKNDSTITLFIYNKVKRLIVPYLFFITFIDSVKYIFNRFATNPIDLSVGVLINHYFYPWNAPTHGVWFLVVLFMMFLVYSLLFKFVIKKSQIYLILTTLFLLFLNIHIYYSYIDFKFLSMHLFFRDLIFFWSGILFAEYTNRNVLKFSNLEIYFICIMSGIFLVYFSFNSELCTPYIKLLLAFAGIIFSYLLVKLYIKFNFCFLDFLYGKSYTVFLLHLVNLMFMGTILKNINSNFWVYFFVMNITNILIPLMVAKIVLKQFGNIKIVKLILGI